MKNIPWDVLYIENDINANLTYWEDLFCSAINEFVPTKKIKDKLTPTWIDKEVKILCRKKDKASKKSLKTKSPEDIECFKSLRRDCKRLIRSKYNGCLHDLSRVVSDNSKSRKIPHAITKDESSRHFITNPQAMADAFNDYFNSVFGRPVSEPPPAGIHPIVPHLSNDLSVISLSTDEVYKALSTLNPSKSPGPD